MGDYLAPVPAVALELLDNLNYDGDRDETCSGSFRVRQRQLDAYAGRAADRIRAMACAVMARTARRAINAARVSNSRGSAGFSGIPQPRCGDGAASKAATVHSNRRRRPGASTSLWVRGCRRAFRPLPTDPDVVHSVASRCTTHPLLLGGRAEDVGAASFKLPLARFGDRFVLRPMENGTTTYVEKAGKPGIRIQAEQRLNGGFGHVHR